MTDGKEGFVLDAPDAAALADRLLRLRDKAMRDSMGQAARRLAERHDFGRILDQIEALYGAQPPHSLLVQGRAS
jgi:glycosyltransferase involved in cell wall biosynthesis